MKFTMAGSGDAFGAGGRLNTCFHVASPETTFLVDCGASALISMHKWGLDPNRVETIFITHLHGDHFAGLIWWMIHGQHVARRTKPLDIAGPAGIAERFKQAAEALFPGSTEVKPRFDMRFHSYDIGTPLHLNGVAVTAYAGVHPSGAVSCALRLETQGRVIAYSGDTEWVDALVDCARDADVFVSECYHFDEGVRYHLHWKTIERMLPRLTAKRIVLTHMGERMLQRTQEIAGQPRLLLGSDGLQLEL